MIKTLLVAFSILCSLALTGQTKHAYQGNKHEIRLSIGSVNDNYYHYEGYNNYGYYSGYGHYGYYSYPLSTPDYERAAYYMGPKKSFGAIALSYYYHVPWINGRFSVGGSVAFSSFSQDYKHRLTNQKTGDVKEYNLALTPSIRYAWIAKPFFQMYSGIGVSVYYNNYKHTLNTRATNHYQYKETGFEASFTITPIGMSVGRRLFGFAELNAGGRAGECVGGVGYRF